MFVKLYKLYCVLMLILARIAQRIYFSKQQGVNDKISEYH